MSEVKRIISRFILIVSGALVAYAFILYLLTSVTIRGNKLIYRAVQGLVWKGGYSFSRFENYDKNDHYDILVFGSSRANRGVNPRVFENAGYSMYNLGTDDQTPLNTLVLVKEYVKENNCRLVIIDLYDKVFAGGSVESSADLIQNLKDDRVAWKMVLASKDLRALNQFGVRTMLKSKAPEYLPDSELYKGFREFTTEFHYSPDRYTYERDETQIQALKETLRYLKKIRIPCYLICQPLPEVPASHHFFVEDINPVLAENGAVLYDFTGDETLAAIDNFSDMSHLNAEGARTYSAFLLDSLISGNIAPGSILAAGD